LQTKGQPGVASLYNLSESTCYRWRREYRLHLTPFWLCILQEPAGTELQTDALSKSPCGNVATHEV